MILYHKHAVDSFITLFLCIQICSENSFRMRHQIEIFVNLKVVKINSKKSFRFFNLNLWHTLNNLLRPCVRQKFPNFLLSRVSEMFGFWSSELFRKNPNPWNAQSVDEISATPKLKVCWHLPITFPFFNCNASLKQIQETDWEMKSTTSAKKIDRLIVKITHLYIYKAL